MLIDKFLQLSDKQAVSATAASTHEIDLGQANPNLGLAGQRLYMVVTVAEAAAGTGKMAFAVQHSDNAGSGYADALVSEKVAAADLKAGAQVVVPMPVLHKRFVRLNYVADGAVGNGKFSAQIVAGLQANTPPADSPRAGV
nr:MAG TPA: major capsid protein [Caudoviricetes sp.]